MAKKKAASKDKPTKVEAEAAKKKTSRDNKKAGKTAKKPQQVKAAITASKRVAAAKRKVAAKAAPKKTKAARVATKRVSAAKAAPKRRAAKKAVATDRSSAVTGPKSAGAGNESVAASMPVAPSSVGVGVATQTGNITSIDATKGTITSLGVSLEFKPFDVAMGVDFDKLKVGDEVEYQTQVPMNVQPVYTGRVIDIVTVIGMEGGTIRPDNPRLPMNIEFWSDDVKPGDFGKLVKNKSNVRFRLKPPLMVLACDVQIIR